MMNSKFTMLLLFLVLTGYQLFTGGCQIQKNNITQKGNTEIDLQTSTASIYSNGKKLLMYTYDLSQFKPYVKELYTPEGLNVLLDSPDDHKHHHGLMFACKVDGINFWEEVENSGKQETLNISELHVESAGTSNETGFSCDVQWMQPETRQVLVYEKRVIKAKTAPELQANIISWESQFRIPASDKTAILSGAHYNGLGMRFLRSMDKDGRFMTADNQKGSIFRGQERLTSARWCAYLAQDGEKKVTIAMFGLPENPRGFCHLVYHERAFCLSGCDNGIA